MNKSLKFIDPSERKTVYGTGLRNLKAGEAYSVGAQLAEKLVRTGVATLKANEAPTLPKEVKAQIDKAKEEKATKPATPKVPEFPKK